MTDRFDRSASSQDRPARRSGQDRGRDSQGGASGSAKGRRQGAPAPGTDGGRGDREWTRGEGRSAGRSGAGERTGRSAGRNEGRGQRGSRGSFGERPRGGDGEERAPRERTHNPSDLRSANRPDRAKSPEIHEDVTGKELHRGTTRELESLDERNRPWVARHLVMAGRLLDIDPELAFEHALAASRRGGRLGCVREAVGITAYAAGEYAEALREFRTYRRITGDNTHLPLMVDSERALGRHQKALELAAEVDPSSLEKPIWVELAMVISGIHQDLGHPEKAVAALEIPELNPRRGFSYSPRLFHAYADALEAAGRDDEAKLWNRRAAVAEEALGVGAFEEPEIIDFGLDDEAETRRPRAKDVVPPGRGARDHGRGADRDRRPESRRTTRD